LERVASLLSLLIVYVVGASTLEQFTRLGVTPPLPYPIGTNIPRLVSWVLLQAVALVPVWIASVRPIDEQAGGAESGVGAAPPRPVMLMAYAAVALWVLADVVAVWFLGWGLQLG
jgi:hypothetical protein